MMKLNSIPSFIEDYVPKFIHKKLLIKLQQFENKCQIFELSNRARQMNSLFKSLNGILLLK